jgi:hypothetical protein
MYMHTTITTTTTTTTTNPPLLGPPQHAGVEFHSRSKDEAIKALKLRSERRNPLRVQGGHLLHGLESLQITVTQCHTAVTHPQFKVKFQGQGQGQTPCFVAYMIQRTTVQQILLIALSPVCIDSDGVGWSKGGILSTQAPYPSQ